MEIEAEGTAFVVASYFGFDTSEYSFPYCTSWNGSEEDVEKIRKAGGMIQKTAKQIIEKVEKKMRKERKKSA
ncbi:hypothetical protein [Aneurinibacillus aneurinilyticus]|uniref:Uncharacterized protein n=1 Tax=Aneurinibacillus aneurinilyticus TaxID=1391 RepID=A0A848D5X4_ANEAE|nr:hypothetical protein [Aneurinibacillus aneurinilyticus]NMF01141.1 hypothetical protein [Aneurinibacillus aneurinilyticus]